MSSKEWFSRGSLGWLLTAQFVLVAAHLEHLPLWVMGIWLFAAGWRVLVFLGRASFPPRWVKVILILVAVAGIWRSYGDWRGLEPMAALLIAGFCFKLMEASTRRDAHILLVLGYFVALTAFLFGQGVIATLHVLLACALLLTAQVALHQRLSATFELRAPRLALLLLLQALPLMLLLFLVVPRLGPLWQVPMAQDTARTGMSDSMAPGDIAQLARSDELAFRVRFAGALLRPTDLYWRGLVFDQFDGRTWRGGAIAEWPLEQSGEAQLRSGPSLAYDVFLEPTGERWLYSLMLSVSDDPGIIETADYRLLSLRPVVDKLRYRAQAWPRAPLDPVLSGWVRERLLRLPAGSNPRTQRFAEQLRERYADDGALIDAVLTHFRTEPFAYTLRPPPLGRHTVDDFLFGTRRGFCEHYAGSFVFLLRAAGIPARVVVGYQGGEVNPLTNTVVVRQYDAHAWAEAWLPERGWVRYDPTAAVAPERVEAGLEQAVGGEEFLADAPLSPNRYRHIAWLNRARHQVDAFNYRWTRFVVNFQADTQSRVLERILGEVTAPRLLLFMLVVGGGTLALVALWLLRGQRRPPLPPQQRLWLRFTRAMAKRGYPCPEGMAPGSYAQWLQAQRPSAQFVSDAARCFEALHYRQLTDSQRQLLLRQLRRQVRLAERAR